MKILNLTFILLLATCAVQSAKILGVFHMMSYSHYIVGHALLKELASRGHEVTMISSFEPKTPIKNYRTILLTEIIEYTKKNTGNILEFSKMGIVETIKMMNEFTYAAAEFTLNSTNVQKLLKSDEKFDVVIMEQFMDEAFRGFQYHYNIPCIIFSTVGSNYWVNPLVGNPTNPAYIPEIMTGFTGKQLSFVQRLQNSFINVFSQTVQYFYSYRQHNELMHKYFPDAPDVTELLYNTSLILLNSHVSYSQPKPHLPNMIEVGGLHISPPGKLPADIKTFLDDAKDGVIYFSLGSNIKSKDMDPLKRDAILKVFSKLKMKVLWKWEEEAMPGQPKNVKIGKWLPQQEILAHPNVKLFVTHGGLMSTIETIYHGKPTLGIPFFGDQKMNIQAAVNNGYAVKLDYEDLTEETFSNVLNEALSNPSYNENAKRRSKIMNDQPMKPVDTAVFWVEYVLRHKGAPHFRSNALDLTWYQYLLLDVIAAVVAPILLVFGLFHIAIRKVFKKSPKKVTSRKKKN